MSMKKRKIQIVSICIFVSFFILLLSHTKEQVMLGVQNDFSKNTSCDRGVIKNKLSNEGAKNIEVVEIGSGYYLATFLKSGIWEYELTKGCDYSLNEKVPDSVHQLQKPIFLAKNKIIVLGVYENLKTNKLGVAFYQLRGGYMSRLKYTEVDLLPTETFQHKPLCNQVCISHPSVYQDERGLLVDLYERAGLVSGSFIDKEGASVSRVAVVSHAQFTIESSGPDFPVNYWQTRIFLGEDGLYTKLNDFEKDLLKKILFGERDIPQEVLNECMIKFYSDQYLLGGCKKLSTYYLYLYATQGNSDYSKDVIEYETETGNYIENSEYIVFYAAPNIIVFDRFNTQIKKIKINTHDGLYPKLRFNIHPHEVYIDWYENFNSKGQSLTDTDMVSIK